MAFTTDRDHGDESDSLRACCATCGREMAINESAEAELVAMGALVEFYHCADRLACRARCSAQIDARRPR